MRRFPFLAVFLLLGFAYAAPAYADSIGQSETFNVSTTYDGAGASEISATLRVVGSTIYVYVDDRYWNSLSSSAKGAYLDRLEMLASDFDAAIHPQSVAFWGNEASPGVDNDPRLTVVVEQLIPGSGGYFQTINSYPKNQAPDSNAREMVFISADSINSGFARDFLTHEFQHLISFNQRELSDGESDDVWLNEVRSEYNITVVGYSAPYSGSTLQRRAQAFLRTPSDSLTEWPNTTTDYSVASVFGHYLTDRYGGGILQYTIHTRERGVQAINEWLEDRNKPERFREVFADWMAALIANDARDPRYGYVTTGLNTLRLVPFRTVRLDAKAKSQWDLQIKDWQPEWIRMDMPLGAPPSPTLTVQVSGHSGSDWGGNAVADYSGTTTVIPWRASGGAANIAIPTQSNGRNLSTVTFAITHGTDEPVNSRMFDPRFVTVSATLDPNVAIVIPGATTGPQPAPTAMELRDGDLINHNGAKEVYVIWGKYRRYLVPGILELYGFQNRPVIPVNDDVFNRYTTSNYIRVVNTEPVYAVWPDGTKHHFNITAAQWDASLRDWNSIFIVNEAEGAFYPTGEDITR